MLTVSIWEPPADGFISIKDQEKATERFHKMDDAQVSRIIAAAVVEGSQGINNTTYNSNY